MKCDKTTIQLKKEVLKMLKEAKKYKRESYEDQIRRMLNKEKRVKL